jgi:hypothetical protein
MKIVSVMEIRDEKGIMLQTMGRPYFHEIACECHPSDYRIKEECEARFLERIEQDMRAHTSISGDYHLILQWLRSDENHRCGDVMMINHASAMDA